MAKANKNSLLREIGKTTKVQKNWMEDKRDPKEI